MACSVLLVLRNSDQIRQVGALLTARGYVVSDACSSGMQALRAAALRPADIAIVGFSLTNMTGLDFSLSLTSRSNCSVMLLTPPEQMSYVKERIGSADITPVPRPATVKTMQSTLEHIERRRAGLVNRIDEAGKPIEETQRRAIAEQAKLVLMNRLQMSEAEAWRYLQKRSMDTGTSLKEIAQRVLNLYKS